MLICVLIIAIRVNGQSQFTALNGPPGANINDLELDVPNSKAYAVINSGLFVTSNDGTNWTKIVPTTPSNLYISDLMIDGGTLYALYYYQLFSSTDGGANWARVDSAGMLNSAYKMIKVNSGVYAAYGYGGVYVSTDSGHTWTQISTQYVGNAVATGNGDLYFSDSQGVKKHSNPGTNPWTSSNVTTILADASSGSSMQLAVLGTTIFATAYYTNPITSTNDILKYNGTSWSSAKTGIAESSFNGYWANSPTGLYFVNNGYSKIYFTTTASSGASWTTLSTWPSGNYGGSNVTALQFVNATKAFAGTNGDGVFLTTNTLSSWSFATGGINLATAQDLVVTGAVAPATINRIYARTGYSSNGAWYSDDKGATWNYLNNYTSQVYRLVETPFGSNTILGIGYNPLQYSSNSGVGWSATTEYFYYTAFNTTFNTGYMYGIANSYNGKQLASSTNGSVWNNITVTGMPSNYSSQGLAQDNAGNIYALVYNGTNGIYEVYKIVLASGAANASTASATLLTFTLTPNDQNYFYPNNFFVNNNKLYLSSGYAIYYTSDQGTTWNTSLFSNNKLLPLPNGNGICASTYGALYVSADDGQSWSSVALPSTDGYISALDYDASTTTYYGGGVNIPAVKDVVTSLVPAAPPPYINFNWIALNGPWGQYIQKILTDKASNTYTLTTNSIYKTTTFSTWTDFSYQGSYINDMAMDTANNTLYGATYNQIISSVNGAGWTLKNGSENFGWPGQIRHCTNGDLIMATQDSKIYVSTNGGSSFGTAKYVLNNASIQDLQVTTTATPGIFVTYYDNTSSTYKVVKSTDRGATWSTATFPSPTITNYAISGGTNNLYFSTYDSVFRSSDNGATWVSITGDFPANYYINNKVFVSPSGGLYVPARINSQYGFLKSTNGGINWTWHQTASRITYISWVGTRLVAGTNQGISTSDDDGATFTERNTGIPKDNLGDLELSAPSKLYATEGSNNYYSTDFQNWNTYTSHHFIGFTRKPDGTLLAFRPDSLFQTTDGGNTWSLLISNLPGLQQVVTADGTTYYGCSNNKIYYSNNLTSWVELNPTGMPSNFYINDIAVDQNGISYFTVYNYTSNSNEAYQLLFGSANKINLVKNPVNVEFFQNKIFLYDQTGLIYSTTDGSTWTKQSTPAGNKLIIASLNYYFIPVSGGNLWLSRDQGQSWQNVGLGSGGNNYFNDVVVNEYNGYAYGAIINSPVRKSANIVIPSDTTPPAVTALSPTNNATGASVKPALSITFDQAAVPVVGKFLKIFDLANPILPIATIDVSTGMQNDKTFTFTSTGLLSFNKTYFVIVDNGAFTDIFGNAWAGITNNSTWRFTTKQTPTVAAEVPAKGSTGIAVDTKLKVIFSEPMVGVAGKQLKLYNSASPSAPTAQVDASAGVQSGDTLTYTLPSALKHNISYYVQYDANALMTADSAVVSLVTGTTDWTFQTVNYPDKKAPVFSYTADNLVKGSGSKVVSVGITDSVGVAPAKMYYRKITTKNGYDSVALVLNASNSKYEATIQESAYGPIGIEFYFKASDPSNNRGRSPSDASNYYYSYINYATSSTATNPVFPALPGTGQVADWRIGAVPYTLSDNKVSTIFDELGAPDKSKWRLLTYKDQSSWAEYPADFTTLSTGVGYFINALNPPTIAIEGATSPNYNKQNQFSKDLQPGWNLIGNPYPFTVTWAEVLAASGNPTGVASIKNFNGTYAVTTQLKAYEGGFVFNSGSNKVTVKFPITAAGAGGRMEGALPSDIDADNWVAPISLTVGNLTSTLGGVGMNPQASESVDDFDDVTAPRFIDYVEMNFPHPEHFAKNLDRDIVPTADEHTWEFTVDSNLDGQASLSWDNTAFGEGGKELYLFDEALQELVDMRASDRYAFDKGVSTRFKVYYGTGLEAKIKPSRVTLGKAYPNPTSGKSVIGFTLPENSGGYQVTVDVYDILGNKAATLVNGRYTAGFYSTEWDASDRAADGVYIYRLVVGGQNGSEAHAGKIILKK